MTNVYKIRQWARSPRRELTMKSTRWTDADDAALRTYFAERMPVERIAPRLGRTVGAVWKRASLIGIVQHQRRPWTATDDETLRKCYADGLLVKWIAPELGRTVGAVIMRVSRLGLANRRVPLRSAKGETT